MVIQCVPDLRERMLAAVHVEGCRLDMGDWFGEPDDEPPCGTVACLAGWAIKCHPQGWQVVEHVRSHPSSAGTYSGSASLILEACGITPPDFFDCGDEDLEKGLDWEAARAAANARAMNWLRTGSQTDPGAEARG